MIYGYTFNGINLNTFGAYLLSKNRQISPSRKVSYIDIPGRDGSLMFDNGLNDRFITISHEIDESTLSNLRTKIRQISSWLNTDDKKQLVFDDEPDKYYMAKVDGTINLDEEIALTGNFDVTFRCEPYAYSVTSNFVSNSATINNVGTTTCFPIFTVTFSSSATEIKISNGTEYVRIVNNFVLGDILVIDCSKGTVKLNGDSIMSSLDWQNSIFFTLKTGLNSLSVTPTNVSSISTSYRERWL